MSDAEIMSTIHDRLSPHEVQEWFRASYDEIRDAVVTIARVDGIDRAVKDTKELFVAWLQAK